MVAIKLHELSKSFQGPVINQLSLTIPDQQITALTDWPVRFRQINAVKHDCGPHDT